MNADECSHLVRARDQYTEKTAIFSQILEDPCMSYNVHRTKPITVKGLNSRLKYSY